MGKFGRDFAKAFSPSYRESASDERNLRADREKLRFQSTLKLEEKEKERKILKREQAEKTSIIINGGGLDNTGLGRDQLKSMAESGLTAQEIREEAISTLDSRNRTRESDRELLGGFLEDSKVAAENQMSLAPTEEIRDVMRRQGVSSLDDAKGLTSSEAPTDRAGLLSTTERGRSVLSEERAGRADLRADRADVRADKIETREQARFEDEDRVRKETLSNLNELESATKEQLKESGKALFGRLGVASGPRTLGLNATLPDLIKAELGSARKEDVEFGGKVVKLLEKGPEGLRKLSAGGRRFNVEQLRIIELVSQRTDSPLTQREIMNLLGITDKDLRSNTKKSRLF